MSGNNNNANNGKKGDGQAYGRRSEVNDYSNKNGRSSMPYNNGSQSFREGGNRRSDASYQQKSGAMTERGQNYGDRDKFYNNKQNGNKD